MTIDVHFHVIELNDPNSGPFLGDMPDATNNQQCNQQCNQQKLKYDVLVRYHDVFHQTIDSLPASLHARGAGVLGQMLPSLHA